MRILLPVVSSPTAIFALFTACIVSFGVALALAVENAHNEPHPSPKRRREDRDSVRVKWSMMFQIVGWFVGLIAIYVAMSNRVTSLETSRDSMQGEMREIKSDMREMKSDIKTLLGRKP